MAEFYMNLIEKHCGRYQSSLINCTETYPVTWKVDCMKEKEKLAMCSSKIPEVEVVQAACSKVFQIYSDCVDKHSADAKVCSRQLHQFMTCATDNLSKIENSSPKPKDKLS